MDNDNPMTKTPRIALITGASSGLGVAFAHAIEAAEHTPYADNAPTEFWLVARRRERLEQLAAELHRPARVFALDVTDPAATDVLVEALREAQMKATAAPANSPARPQHRNEAQATPILQYLVLSAGLGDIGAFADLDEAQHERMIALNIEAMTRQLAAFHSFLAPGAQVFPIASVAAFLPQPDFATYAATKAYVLSLSRALHAEWKADGITVTAVCPNPMETEFFTRTESNRRQSSSIKQIGVESPDAVARYALKRAAAGKDIAVRHALAKGIHLASKLFPTRFILVMEKVLGIY